MSGATATALGLDTVVTVFAAGLIFLLALVLGIGKYRQMATSESHLAHPYVDIAHRRGGLRRAQRMAHVGQHDRGKVLVFFFVAAIVEYIVHGMRRDTTNQFEHVTPALTAGMVALIIGEIGGFAVLLTGFVVGQLF